MSRFEDIENAGLRVAIEGNGLISAILDEQGRNTGIQTGKIAFPGFAPRLLASLAASSTAACTSGVVTVTATAHGLAAAVIDGADIYYPGSPSLSAGWYRKCLYINSSTITFESLLTSDFASESINSGNAFVDEVTICSLVIPANSINVGDVVTISTASRADSVASAKTWRMKIGSDAICTQTVSTSSANGFFDMSFYAASKTSMRSANTRNHSLTTSGTSVTSDLAADMIINYTIQLAAAGMYVFTPTAKLRIS